MLNTNCHQLFIRRIPHTKTIKKHTTNLLTALLFFIVYTQCSYAEVINDVTQLNPINVQQVIAPTTLSEIQNLVKNHHGAIAIGGGRYSQGGQTASENALALDMRQFKQVVNFNPEQKEITVQTGMTWHDMQTLIDPYHLSVKIMQTYANFTVGGSLSVNVHGRYMGHGAMVDSVKSLKIVLANGDIVTASPKENSDIFYAAIGGYGGIGVIVEATLALDDNIKVERQDKVMAFADYPSYFAKNINTNDQVVFHNADIYPPQFDTVRAVSFIKTEKDVTITDHLKPTEQGYSLEKMGFWAISELPFGKGLRRYVIDPLLYLKNPVEWRNYEASYDVHELEPKSRTDSTYVLQEYFVPTEQLATFVPQMTEILNRHHVNTINISIRHASPDTNTLLAWAKTEVFALVLYYKQGTTEADKNAVGVWTRELISAAIAQGGSYYLPYQPHATIAQFHAAYPKANDFFALKQHLDPDYKFRNQLWDKYYGDYLSTQNTTQATTAVEHVSSRFKHTLAIPEYNDGMYLFLQNVYGLYPADKFHQLIIKATAEHDNDRDIYNAIQRNLKTVTPSLWAFRYALPALKKQKHDITQQTVALIGKKQQINGYLEIGTTGRYVNTLKKQITIKAPIFLINDEQPSYSPTDITERGQINKLGKFLDLNDYEPIARNQIADESLDMVTIYIGLHHAPREKLDAFVASVWRVLRPNGKLIIRDHDVDSAEFNQFVSLIHDAFYSGLNKDWDYTSHEPRFFISANELTQYLESKGFKTDGRRLLQDHDPSRNTLMLFTKQASPAQQTEINIHQTLDNWPAYRRDEGQTYLTFPEWFLVYNPDEYAQHLKTKKPSAFPYFSSIAQVWDYYGDVSDITSKQYPFNGGYHLMVSVLASSYTVENGFKGVYENSIGRISELLSTQNLTTEDQLAATVAQDYVDFILTHPWYEYSFSTQLKKLWFNTSLIGKNPVRKLERRLFLSTEYLEKAMYATLITGATHAIYGTADTEILARISVKNADVLAQNPNIKILKTLDDQSLLIALPRYLEFRDALITLSQHDVRFLEIAGNQKILISCLAARDYQYHLANGILNTEKPVLTQAQQKRLLITASIPHLHELLPQLQQQGVEIEHIYDY